jgi:DNA primase
MDIKDLIEEAGFAPKRKAATNGGEYSSPCPFCKDGQDRFLIWPSRTNKNGEYQGGRYSCRVCGKFGDAISFLCDLQGLRYTEACQRLKIEPKQRLYGVTSKKSESLDLPIAKNPPALWIEKASAFIEWSHKLLMKDAKRLLYLMDERGLYLETIERFKLGFCPGQQDEHGIMKDILRSRESWGLSEELKEDGIPKRLWLPQGLVIPTIENNKIIRLKIRRTGWKEGDKLPKYAEVSGCKKCFSIFGDTSLNTALILEAEFDAILMQQEAGDSLFCVALGGSTKPLDKETNQVLKNTKNLLFCPDFDKAGATAWTKWKKMFPNIKRILTPEGKDPCEAFKVGVNLREWIELELQENK